MRQEASVFFALLCQGPGQASVRSRDPGPLGFRLPWWFSNLRIPWRAC